MADRASHSKAPQDHRRKWDTVEYEKNAKAREDLEKALNRDREKDKKEDPIQREMLRVRDYKVDLESKLGKSVVITKDTPNAQAGGYYCNVCDCLVKVSAIYFDSNDKSYHYNLPCRILEISLITLMERSIKEI